MNNTLYAKIKDDLFGGLLEFVKRYWSRLLPSTALYLLLILLVSGYPLFLYVSKLMPLLKDFMEEARNGVQQDPEAFQEAVQNAALNEMLIFQGALTLFSLVVGTWFHLSWLKMGKDIILKGDLQAGESYLSGHKMPVYLNAMGYTFLVSAVSLLLSFGVNKVAPVMGFPLMMIMLMVTMQLLLVVPYIFLEELGIADAVRKSLSTITPLIALKYAALVIIGILAAVVGIGIVMLLLSALLIAISPILAAIFIFVMTIAVFFLFMFIAVSFPSVVYYHHTDVSTKDYESSPYDSFG